MGKYTEYFIALVEYFAAEAKQFRIGIVHLALAIGFALAAVLTAVAAIGCFALALYRLMVHVNPTWAATGGAAAVLGSTAVFCMLVLLWIAKRIVR